MIDWVKAVRSIKCEFDNDCQGGSGYYVSESYGEIDFIWESNKSKLQTSWFNSSPICHCGKGMLDIDCDCEWDWFIENEPTRKVFTKNQVHRLSIPSLF